MLNVQNLLAWGSEFQIGLQLFLKIYTQRQRKILQTSWKEFHHIYSTAQNITYTTDTVQDQ